MEITGLDSSIPAIDEQKLEEKAIVSPRSETEEKVEKTYVQLIRQAYANGMMQSTHMGAANSERTTGVRREIVAHSKHSAQLSGEIGKTAGLTAAVGFVCSMFQLSNERQSVLNFMRWIGDSGTQALNNVISSGLYSKQRIADALLAMAQTNYQQLANKDPATSIQQLLQSLGDAGTNIFRQVAAAG